MMKVATETQIREKRKIQLCKLFSDKRVSNEIYKERTEKKLH